MTDDTEHPEDNDAVLAGELALRVLSPDDEVAARAREASDAGFAAEVEAWNDRLGRMAEDIAPVQPSSGVWPRVEARLPVAANDNARVEFWRRWAVGSTGLLAASLVAVIVLAVGGGQDTALPVAPPTPADVPVRVATLTLQEGGQAALTLVYDPGNGSLYISPTQAIATDARVPHLWLVLPNEAGVQLIGAIDGTEASRRRLDAALTGQAGTAVAMAISMEALGNNPAPNKPDGPVVAVGELQKL